MTDYIISDRQTSSGITLHDGDELTILFGGDVIGTTLNEGGDRTYPPAARRSASP